MSNHQSDYLPWHDVIERADFMETSLERGFQKPLDILDKRCQYYRSIDVRIAAIKVGGRWNNLRAVFMLTSDKVAHDAKREIETEDFKVIRKEIPPTDLRHILTSISTGELTVQETTVVFRNNPDQSMPSLQHETYCSRSSRFALQRWGIPFPIDEFRMSTQHSFHDGFEKVSSQLQCYPTPYEDMFEAVNEALELQDAYRFREWNGHNDAIAYILMPNYLAFHKCKLKGNSLRVSIRFHESIDAKNLRLSLIAKGKKDRKEQLNFSIAGVRRVRGYQEAELTKNIEGSTGVLLYLFELGKESEGPADEMSDLEGATTNLSMLAHEHFDTHLDILQKWMRGEGRERAGDFEMSVLVLLHICGFRVEWVGHLRTPQDLPDILAFGPNSDLIVGECTVDLPDDKKIRMIAKRAKQLSGKLGTTALPVLFLSLNTTEAGTTVFQTAHQEGVKILTSDDLTFILNRYARTAAARDVLRYVREVIHSG
jgi:hypothetical protein